MRDDKICCIQMLVDSTKLIMRCIPRRSTQNDSRQVIGGNGYGKGLFTRFDTLSSRAPLGRVRARAKVSCIQGKGQSLRLGFYLYVRAIYRTR